MHHPWSISQVKIIQPFQSTDASWYFSSEVISPEAKKSHLCHVSDVVWQVTRESFALHEASEEVLQICQFCKLVRNIPRQRGFVKYDSQQIAHISKEKVFNLPSKIRISRYT